MCRNPARATAALGYALRYGWPFSTMRLQSGTGAPHSIKSTAMPYCGAASSNKLPVKSTLIFPVGPVTVP